MKFLKSLNSNDVWFLFNTVLFIVNLLFAFFAAFGEDYAKAAYFLVFATLFYIFNAEERILRQIKDTGHLRPINVTLSGEDSETVAEAVRENLKSAERIRHGRMD